MGLTLDLEQALEDINMAEKLPAVKALPDVMNKMYSMLNASATKAAEEVAAAGEHGAGVIGQFSAKAKEVRQTMSDVAKTLEETNEATTNASPTKG